ncbi:MAG TPA: DNA polymerase III subunit epsilon [Thermohalobaculum sp.]|nr:DNA polymerase III subunit epsilon [Thermohalobaculum sp.]
MREIVLDTETTGLDPADGHRIVEIGAIELVNLLPTGRIYHQFINPERPVPREATAVHGHTDAFLADKPVFAAIAPAFLAFIGDARLVIHNAAFDLRMLNAELARIGAAPLAHSRALDTLETARARFPGAPASLDALCRRFAIDNAGREKHGALLDCELLAEVYLELMGGRQRGLALDGTGSGSRRSAGAGEWRAPPRPRPLPPRLTPEEQAAHEAFVAELGDESLWRREPFD